MSAIQLFNNGEFELSVTASGTSFTVSAPGMARAMSFRSAADMVRHLPVDEKGYVLERTPGGNQKVWYVTEPGFYRILGQRQPNRIKNDKAREGVERFQRWVYHEVLPSVTRGGSPVRHRDEFGAAPSDVYNYDEVCALLRQRYGIDLDVNELTRNLRAGGVLKQNVAPAKRFKHMFWLTGTGTWNIHRHVIPQIAFKVFDTGREMQDFRFLQARLELEGVGQPMREVTR